MECKTLLVLATLAFHRGAASLGGPTVTVPDLGDLNGKYSSLFSHDVTMFLGIPFAKPPVGELRWMAPQAYGAWKSPRDATKYSDTCVGAKKDGTGGPGSSEDCLFLNVVARSSAVGGPPSQPVLVWIYGGTFDTGSANQFTPETMVGAAQQVVVVVTLNYRMNTFGFLGSKALAARSPDGSTGNYGLDDQRLAMMWVRDHIAAFGGRGGDVTIFGESAGGNSVLHHLVQPASFGLYSKAIIESGTYDSGYQLSDAQGIYDATIEKTGCGTNLDCFLNKTTKEVEVAKNAMAKSSKLPELHWGPVVDGVLMTGTPQELIAAGKFNTKVPVLMGSNRDEFAVLITSLNATAYNPNMDEARFDEIVGFLGPIDLKKVKQLYDPSVYTYPADLGHYSQWWWTAMRIATDNGIPQKGFPKGIALGHCSARRIGEQLLRGGTPKLYLYNFARPLVGGQVGHGEEIPFVFPSPLLGLGGNRELSTSMVNYWAHFADTANPSPSDASRAQMQWPSYSPDGDKANIRFDATFGAQNITIQHGFRSAACDFWDQLSASSTMASREIIV